MESYLRISQDERINGILNSLPYVAGILNEQRQFVFVNKALLELLNLTDPKYLLGQRPGETYHCIHASENEGGCGTSESCRYCGAVQTILESQKKQDQARGECRITAQGNEGTVSYDLQITAKPFETAEHTFTLLLVDDQSDEKRRKALERIFFHDVLNKAGSMDGLMDILSETNDLNEIRSLLAVVQTVTHQLVGEIQFQREISLAESDEIEVKLESFNPVEWLSQVVDQMRHHEVAREKHIEMISATETLEITTDPVLLSRVLTNMLKNALEAVRLDETVTAMVYDKGDQIGFCVQNPTILPDHIKAQIFQRSFSTKGTGRGLGTYSIKLLGEKYLHGKVFFSSTIDDGTQFFIELPRRLK